MGGERSSEGRWRNERRRIQKIEQVFLRVSVGGTARLGSGLQFKIKPPRKLLFPGLRVKLGKSSINLKGKVTIGRRPAVRLKSVSSYQQHAEIIDFCYKNELLANNVLAMLSYLVVCCFCHPPTGASVCSAKVRVTFNNDCP